MFRDSAASGHQTETEHAILIGGFLGVSRQSPMAQERRPLKDSCDDVGIADIDCKQHGMHCTSGGQLSLLSQMNHIGGMNFDESGRLCARGSRKGPYL